MQAGEWAALPSWFHQPPGRCLLNVPDEWWEAFWVLPSLEVDAPNTFTGLKFCCHDEGSSRPHCSLLRPSLCVHLALPLPQKNSHSCGVNTRSRPGDLGH